GAAGTCLSTGTPDGLVAEERAVRDGNVRVKQVLDGAAKAAGGLNGPAAADRLVVGELTVRDGRGRAELTIEGAPGGIVEEARIDDVAAEGTVVGEVAVFQCQRGLHPILNRPADAAAQVGRRACASRNDVVRQQHTDEVTRVSKFVDGAAEVVEAHACQGLVVAQGSADHAQAGTIRIEDGAAASAAPARVEVHRRAG